ncbi:MAG: LysR substrate-binding domain-containing protein [Acidimicrobiia bacterium]|nr:LysR substrate-binding domain-containing protein [Acidimicrobiia bacterium]
MVTLRQLEVFAAVVASGSVTAAAHRLYVSQPSVSDTLRAIETDIGAPLFVGRGRARELSPAGQIYIEHTRRILATVDQAAQAVADLREKPGGRLRILAVTTVGEHLLPRMLRGFLDQFPDVELTLQVSNRGEARRALEEAAVDLAVMGRPPEGLAVEVRPFAPNRLHLVCASGYQLVVSATVDARAGATLLVREEGSGSRAAAEEAMEQLGWRPARIMVLGSNAALLAATRESLGVAVIPELAVADDLRSGRLVRVPVPGFPMLREWQAVWPSRRQLSRPAAAFLDHLLEVGPRLVAG